MDAARWQCLSPQLDRLLDLAPDARASALAQLGQTDRTLAADLERLLALEQSGDGWPGELYDTTTLQAGAAIGPYVLDALLGEGGMGVVWRAHRADGHYQRTVAIKLLRPGHADRRLRERFARERDILARLEHPHIARLLDAGVAEHGQPWLALDHVQGQPITDYCRQHGLDVDARLALFAQVCEAVAHAHAALVVHRDLKPSNILVTTQGQVRLLDFGIATLLDAPSAGAAQTEARAFTLHYAAPEQLRGQAVTTRTDVYALGMVLFELLAGTRPFQQQRHDEDQWRQAVLHGQPLRPSQAVLLANRDPAELAPRRRLARQLRGDLDRIALKAIATDPHARYASVEALGMDLACHRQGRPVLARGPGLGYRLQRYAVRRRWWLAGGGLAAGLLVAALATSLHQADMARREAARAQVMQAFVVGLFDTADAGQGERGHDPRRLLETGLARGQAELAGQPLALAELLAVAARLRIGLGDYHQALDLLERAQRLLDSAPPAPASLRLAVAAQHGRALRLLDRSGECVPLLAPLLPLAAPQAGAPDPLATDYLSQYGRCLRLAGHSQQAQALFGQALQRRRQAGEPLAVAESLLDLARTATDLGEETDALARYGQALDQLEHHGGAGTPLEIDILRGLGAAQRLQGNIDAAQASFTRALDLATRLHGANHPAATALRSYLMALDVDRGRYTAAEQQARELLSTTLEQLGPYHRDTGLAWNSLGVIAMERGDDDEALADIGQAVTLWRAPGSEGLLHGGLFNYGLAQLAAGDLDKALEAFTQSRRLRLARYGPASALVGDADRMIGQVLAARGDPAAAAPWLASAVRLTGSGALLRYRNAVLAQARNQARLGDAGPALSTLDALAGLPVQGSERARLAWTARAYAAEARCRTGLPSGLADLHTLQADLLRDQPEGGTLPREVDAIAQACNGHLLATRGR